MRGSSLSSQLARWSLRYEDETGTMMLRVSAATHEDLQELAGQDQVSIQEVIGKAVETCRRERIIAGTNAGYAALRSNGRAWKKFQGEQTGLDGALMDGLDDACRDIRRGRCLLALRSRFEASVATLLQTLQPVAQDRWPIGGQHRLGMELHPLNGILSVP